jgi:hypothetical protein
MNNPEYRLATLCPMGMSEELKNYLNKSTPDGGLMKEFIANNPRLGGSTICYGVLGGMDEFSMPAYSE